MIVCERQNACICLQLQGNPNVVRPIRHASNACMGGSIMLAPLTSEPIALAARCVHRIESAKGVQIACVRGAIWVTQERDPRDWVLMAGQSVVLERAGLAVVFAFKDALITSGAAQQLPAAANVQPTRRPERACA